MLPMTRSAVGRIVTNQLARTGTRSLPLIAVMTSNACGNRSCSIDWIKRLVATGAGHLAVSVAAQTDFARSDAIEM